MTATATSEPCLEESARLIAIVVVGDDEVKRILEGPLKMPQVPSICSLVSIEDSVHFHHLGQYPPAITRIGQYFLRSQAQGNGALGCLLLAS